MIEQSQMNITYRISHVEVEQKLSGASHTVVEYDDEKVKPGRKKADAKTPSPASFECRAAIICICSLFVRSRLFHLLNILHSQKSGLQAHST